MSWLADAVDNTGTFLRLPEFGISEALNGGKPTVNTKKTTTNKTSPAANNTVNTFQDDGAISSGGYDYSGGGGGGGGSYADQQAALYQIDQGLAQYNDALARTDRQQQTALGNIENDYNSGYNRLLGSQAAAKQKYEFNKNNQTQDYVNARNDITNNSRNLVLNARRLLGAQGAGGGSADRYAVSNAAQMEGANQNAKVQQTNARNLAALDMGRDEDERNFKNSFSDLASQREKSIRNTQSQFEQTRADVLNAIAQLTGQRRLATGGSYQQALSAASPYTGRVSGILDNIDRLAANPTNIREQAVTLANPNLANYMYDRFTGPVSRSAAPQDTSLSALAALLGSQQDDQRNQLV